MSLTFQECGLSAWHQRGFGTLVLLGQYWIGTNVFVRYLFVPDPDHEGKYESWAREAIKREIVSDLAPTIHELDNGRFIFDENLGGITRYPKGLLKTRMHTIVRYVNATMYPRRCPGWYDEKDCYEDGAPRWGYHPVFGVEASPEDAVNYELQTGIKLMAWMLE